jgi:hypothetical protein
MVCGTAEELQQLLAGIASQYSGFEDLLRWALVFLDMGRTGAGKERICICRE